MSIKNELELKNTERKLAELQAHYAARKVEPTENPEIREISLRSVKRMINQLREEIARFKARVPV